MKSHIQKHRQRGEVRIKLAAQRARFEWERDVSGDVLGCEIKSDFYRFDKRIIESSESARNVWYGKDFIGGTVPINLPLPIPPIKMFKEQLLKDIKL